MSNDRSALADWTPEQIAQGRRWVTTRRRAGAELARVRREELRELDTYRSIELLCSDNDHWSPPYAPKPWSGLVEQQRRFKKAAGRE